MSSNHDTPVQRFEVAVAIVRNAAGRILVNKRPEGSYYGGWWEWPGGKRQAGESLEACALRELREEIGIRVRVLGEVDKRSASYPGRIVDLTYYLCEFDESSAPHERALEHRWLTIPEIRELRFLEQNLPVLDLLESL